VRPLARVIDKRLLAGLVDLCVCQRNLAPQ
jgi:hypothetical protein